MKKINRIMLCGASGTGKTTLANHLSEVYDIPYLNSSARKTWDKYGFKNHYQAYIESVKDPSVGVSYQSDILNERFNLLAGQEKFITDRSFIDNAAYMLLTLGHHVNREFVLSFLMDCETSMRNCDALIFCRYTDDISFEDEKQRILNPYFQKVVDQIISWLIEDKQIKISCPGLNLTVWNYSSRIETVETWLKSLQ